MLLAFVIPVSICTGRMRATGRGVPRERRFHNSFRNGKRHTDAGKIGFSFFVGQQLSQVPSHSLHESCKMGQSSEEALMIVGFKVCPALLQALESPSVDLSRKAIVFAVRKILATHHIQQQMLVKYLPTPTMGHPAYDMEVFRIRQNAVKLRREIGIELLALFELACVSQSWIALVSRIVAIQVIYPPWGCAHASGCNDVGSRFGRGRLLLFIFLCLFRRRCRR